MPIYEYRCSSCGHEEEFLQKVTDPVLTQCPACGKATFEKQLSAAGFQLKGSGWYATDFKSKPAEKKGEAKSETKTETKAETKSEPKPKTAAATD
jgi:putative FmdB family regulatory protein